MLSKKELRAAWKTCTPAELDAAKTYLDWCATQLGLPHWTLYIGPDGPCPDDAYADCDVNPTRYMAKIRLWRGWTTLDRWAQANALLHECIHVTHHQLTEVVYDHLPKGTPTKAEGAFRVAESMVELQAERMADQLATALTDSLGAVKVWKRIRRDAGL